MAYGILKCDQITFTNGGIDQTVTVSGIVQSISGNITATGTIQAATIIGTSTVSGATVTGTAGVFTTVTGGSAGFTTVTGTTVTGTTANFATLSGTTITGSVGNFGSGSAAAPSVSVGTTDNGVYSPGTDQVAISTNGTGRLSIDTNGHVTALTGGMVVAGSPSGFGGGEVALGAATASLQSAISTASTGTPALIFDHRGSSNTGSFIWRNGTGGSSELMRVTGDGKLGLGTSTPGAPLSFADSNAFKIQFNGNVANYYGISKLAGGGSLGDGEFKFTAGNVTAGAFTFSSAGSEKVRIDNQGRLAVGTTSPTRSLVVAAGSTSGNGILVTGSNSPSYRIEETSGSVAAQFGLDGSASYFGTSTNHPQVFNTNSTERARIDTSGRLLVGTSSSIGVDSKLQIASAGASNRTALEMLHYENADASSQLTFTKSRGTTVGSSGAVTGNDDLGAIYFRGDHGAGVGYAANIRAEADGAFSAGNYPGRLVFSTTAASAGSSTERMRITNDGKVGVGTTPGTGNRLHIADTSKLSTDRTGIKLQTTDALAANTGLPLIWSGNIGTQSDYTWASITGRKENATSGNAAGYLQFATGSSAGSVDERARIDSSGRLLVGTTSTSATTTALFQGSSGGVAPGIIRITSTSSSPADGDDLGALAFGDSAHGSAVSINCQRDGGTWSASSKPSRLVFSTTKDGQSSPTEACRIDSSQNLLVGTTAALARLAVTSAAATVSPIATNSVSGDLTYQAILVTKFDNNTTTSQNFIQFQVNNGAANCGRITANGANTAAFGSTSDIRLKENIEDLPPQLQNILSLRPVEFDYIESEGGGHQIGFIAQEMQAVYPDVVNERGEDDMLMITGWSKTEARLVKAIQEQQAIIEGLEARLAALETP